MEVWEREQLHRDLIDLANGLQVALERLWSESKDEHDRKYLIAQSRRAQEIRERRMDFLLTRGYKHDLADG